jgi:small subunit ribosomal protein S17
MADEKNEKNEEAPVSEDAPVEETAAEAGALADEVETPAEEPSAEAEVEETAAEEAPVEKAAAEEAVAEADVEAEPAQEAPETVEPEAAAEADISSEEAVEPEVAAEAERPAEAAEPSGEADAEAEKKRKKKRLPRALRQPRTKLRREKPAERRPISRLPKPEHERGRTQQRQGTVVSAAMDKTIVVRVDTVKVHPRYKKVIRRSSKFHAHDERNEAKVGDVVLIVETRPISRMKRWRLQQIVQAAK